MAMLRGGGTDLQGKGASEMGILTDPVPVNRNFHQFGFPNQTTTSLRYAQQGSITSTIGGIGNAVFSCNSLFDPDRTGVGHQPLYYDQLTPIYNHYTVVSSRIWIEFHNPSTTATGLVGVVVDDDATGSASLSTRQEQNSAKSGFIAPLAGHSYRTFEAEWDSLSVLGIDPFTDGSNKTATGSNPTEESFFHLFFATINPAGGTEALIYNVVIEYNCIFSELITPTGS